MKRITNTITPFTTVIRLLGVVQNPANGFPARPLGTFLRSFRWGHVRQLDRVSRELLARAWSAGAGPGDAPLTIDLDSAICIPIYWNRAWPVRLSLPIIPGVDASSHRFGGFGLSNPYNLRTSNQCFAHFQGTR